MDRKQKYWLLMPMLVLVLAVIIAAGIGGASTAYGADTGGVHYEEEYAVPGDSLHVTGDVTSGNGISYKWFVDNKELNCTSSTYCVTSNDMEKIIRTEVWKSGKKIAQCSMICSKLPVLYIDTEGGQDITSRDVYLSADLKVQGCDKYNSSNSTLYTGKAEIKGRGHSTWKRFDKKPYKIKLDKKTDLFGLGKNKHWVLLANYIDESGMRNMLASYYGKVLGTTAMDGLWVDVVLNGKSIGMYQLSEQVRVDKNRVDIYDWEDTADDIAKAIAGEEGLSDDDESALETRLEGNLNWVTTDQITCKGKSYTASDYYERPDSFNGGALMEIDSDKEKTPGFRTTRDVPVIYDAPELTNFDSTFAAGLQNSVQRLEDSFYSPDKCIRDIGGARLSYVDLCDSDSLISFWMTSELMRNEIGEKSTDFYKDIDQPVKFGPVWDFDWSSDSVAPFGASSATSWVTDSRAWFSEAKKNPYFAVKARELFNSREDDLRETIQSGGTIDQWHDYIQQAALQNEKLWKYSRGFEKDTVALKTWITKRINWMSRQFATDQSAMQSLGVPLSDKLSLELSGDGVVNTSGKAYETAATGDKVLNTRVSIPDNTYASLAYYINGRYIGTVRLDGEQEVPLIMNESQFTEPQGKKNVISVWLKDKDGNLLEQQYCTLKFTKGDSQYCDVLLNEPGTARVIKVVSGTKLRLPEFTSADKTMLFTGWRKDGSTEDLQPGTKMTISSPVTLTAHFAECSDTSIHHEWEKSGNGYRCRKCGIEKADDTEYLDISRCGVRQSSRYGTRYTGKSVAPAITVLYYGKVLTEGKDYKLTFTNNVNTGYATYRITGIKSAGFDGSAELSYKIVPRKITAASYSLKEKVYPYNGRAKTPKADLYYNGIKLIQNKDYTLSYSNNRKIGKATVVITGTGNFTGTRKVSFKIVKKLVPGKTYIKKLKRKSKRRVTVYWKKQTRLTTGYQIRYASNKKFHSSRYVTIKSNKTTAKTITMKRSKKRYYIKIRTYKRIDGKRYYSSWSKKKSIVTKR